MINDDNFNSMTCEELEKYIINTQEILEETSKQNTQSESLVHHEKSVLIEKVKKAETEEEFITNKLLKRLEDLKADRAK